MNKRAASKYVEENDVTFGQMKAAVSATRGRREMSTVNPQFTLDEMLDIFNDMLAEHDDDETIPVWGYRRGREIRTGLSLGVQNIVRECM